MPEIDPIIDEKAKSLRKNMTKEEGILWHMFLKKLPVHVYRQRVIGNYIVDFCCYSAKLIIELDGSQHYENASSFERDKKRTKYIESEGFTVVRFQNNQITRNLRGVCNEIVRLLKERLPDVFKDWDWQ